MDIEISQVCFAYDSEFSVFQDLSMTIRRGEILAIIGQNGVGKTTLLRLIAGLLRPSQGTIMIGGKPTRHVRASKLSQQVSLAFQVTHHQFFKSTVLEEVEVSLRNHITDAEAVQKRVTDICRFFGLESLRNRHPFSLSGGEKRRLTLAILQAMDSDFLLLDEPTQGLDKPGRNDLLKFIQERKITKRGIVIATHDLPFGFMVADKILVLESGSIKATISDMSIKLSGMDPSIPLPQLYQLARSQERLAGKIRLQDVITPRAFASVIQNVIQE